MEYGLLLGELAGEELICQSGTCGEPVVNTFTGPESLTAEKR